ncbi:MAG: chemotaxis protein CheW [Peptococcia bacterium]
MAEQKFVVFRLQDEEYGLNIEQVNEILVWQEPTKYPQGEELITGIINLRGKIIPIIDLKMRFYGVPINRDDNVRIIVANNGEQILGLAVDEVIEVIVLNDNMIEVTPDIMAKINPGVSGVGKLTDRLLILLDITKIFSLGEFDQIESAAN